MGWSVKQRSTVLWDAPLFSQGTLKQRSTVLWDAPLFSQGTLKPIKMIHILHIYSRPVVDFDRTGTNRVSYIR